jgi:uncharacterized protein (TIGR02646 family)
MLAAACAAIDKRSYFATRKAQQATDYLDRVRVLRDRDKSGTHSALLNEQGYVCAYCGRAVNADRSDSHIDHFWPQAHFNGSAAPDRTLDYDNFFVSCGPIREPGSRKTVPRTCGDAKGDWFDPVSHIMPSDPNCERRFTYGATGEISPSVPGGQAALNMIKHLYLQEKGLQYERQQMIADVETAIEHGAMSRVSLADELRFWRTPKDALGRLPSLGDVAARYLETEFPDLPTGPSSPE